MGSFVLGLVRLRSAVCLRYKSPVIDVFQPGAGVFIVQSIDSQVVDVGVRGLGDAVRAYLCMYVTDMPVGHERFDARVLTFNIL